MDRSSVDKLIQSSKERSHSKYKLSSNAKSPILRLRSEELKHRSEQFLHQIGAAVSEVDRSALLPSRTRYCLLISDADGVVIESYAPEGLEAEFHRSGLAPGSIWNEQLAGTNGIAMSMLTGRVLTVRGKEHFYNCFHNFSCSSAPLTDAENNLIGTITLVGSAGRRPEDHAFCEQVVRRASRQFQTRLFRNFHSEKMTARLLSRDPGLRRSFETLVACNEDGVVVSHLPLWRDEARPREHQNLTGRHISDLHDLEISLRGPAMIPPRRRVAHSDTPRIPARVDKNAKLGRLIAEGCNLSVLTERARKLVAHRVPLLVCGEPGVGTATFARVLLEDQSLDSPMAMTLDAARNGAATDLAEALQSLEFLRDYPVDKVVPTLILRNIDCLSSEAQTLLERFLDAEDSGTVTRTGEQHPVLLFTADKPWSELENGGSIPRNLLYLLGQSVVELPPLRQRDREIALENALAEGFPDGFQIADSARKMLVRYHWPGNHREMRAVLREALICGNGKRINMTDLPERLLILKEGTSKSLTRAALSEALDSTNWNVTKAARLLGKSRATINRWIASERLQRPG